MLFCCKSLQILSFLYGLKRLNFDIGNSKRKAKNTAITFVADPQKLMFSKNYLSKETTIDGI